MRKSDIEMQYTKKMKEFKTTNLGVSTRRLIIGKNEVFILYMSQITDRDRLSENILKPIVQYKDTNNLTIEKIAYSLIYFDDIILEDNIDKMTDYILKGYSVIFIKTSDQYIVANTIKIKERSVEIPQLEQTLRGPRDSFTENIDTNLSLIRYRIKDPELRVDNYTVGKRTKTNVCVIYIKDVANPKYVNEIKKRIEKINVDGIVESGYIQKFIRNDTFNMFPQAGITERSDKACEDILEGKICVVVEGSPIVLSMPKVFAEFFDSSDDHYDNIYLGILTKIIRELSFLIALTFSSLYVAVVSFHPDILPPQYILALAIARSSVPFNALTEAMLMELTSELLKEASIRLPKQVGPAIGIVGTIVIGQAAVQAKLVSPLMVIVVSIVTMASLVAPDYSIMNPIRVYKFLLLALTGLFGLYGFIMGITIIVINLISTNSFGVAYTSPFAPFNLRDIKNYMLSDITLAKERANFLNTKDNTRQ